MRLIAFCYLQSQGDERNKCLLFEQELKVIKDGRAHQFPLEDSIGFYFSRRKWMLPLIIGSILFCLSLLFIFRNLINPWISLTIIVLSLYSIYIGWEGSPVLEVRSGGVTNLVPIRRVSVNLKGFLRFVESYQKNYLQGQAGLNIYHMVFKNDWVAQEDHDFYKNESLEKEGFIHCSMKDQVLPTYRRHFGKERDMVMLSIDPLLVNCEIKYEKSMTSGQLFPHIYGPIEKKAVTDFNDFKGDSELQTLLSNI